MLKLNASMCNIQCSGRYHVTPEGEVLDIPFQGLVVQCLCPIEVYKEGYVIDLSTCEYYIMSCLELQLQTADLQLNFDSTYCFTITTYSCNALQ